MPETADRDEYVSYNKLRGMLFASSFNQHFPKGVGRKLIVK